jgi:hypothetical protein
VLSDVDGAIRELDYLVESAAGRSSAGVAGSNTLSHGGNSHYAGGVAHQTWFEQHRYQGCPVGCGPVAWILLFGWGDMEAHYGLRGWGPRWGLYRKNGGKGADELIPDGTVSANLGGPRNVMEELNGYVDVWCPNSNNGATFPWDMNEAKAYFRGRTGTTLETHLNPTGSPCPRCKNEIVESIKGNDRRKEETPAVVGKGWLSHYPLAYGFYDGWHDFFKVNNGWGWDHDQRTEWIWAETWFSGEIHTYR